MLWSNVLALCSPTRQDQEGEHSAIVRIARLASAHFSKWPTLPHCEHVDVLAGHLRLVWSLLPQPLQVARGALDEAAPSED